MGRAYRSAAMSTVRGTIVPAIVGLVAALAPAPAFAAPGYASRQVGGWTVAPSKDGKGCFLTRIYDRAGETTLLLGLDTDDTNHLSVLNANWSIKPKDKLKLTFRLSKGAYPRHFAVGLSSEGKRGFVTSFESKFPGYFATSATLDISRGEVPVERLSLTGSGAAVAELRLCVAAQRAKPVAKSGAKPRADTIPLDPFAAESRHKSRK